MFGIGTIVLAYVAPGYVGRNLGADSEEMSAGEIISKGLPIALLILLVLGGIYAGFFTPVEAGGIGAAGALVIGLVKGRLDWAALWRVLVDTGMITASISFLIIAAQMYSRMLAFSGVPAGFGEMVAGADMTTLNLVLLYCLVVILMGMILDSGSIMLILVPLMLPVITSLGVDLVWFGIITVIAVEIGLLTPPFGISVYVIKATLNDPDISLKDIFFGAAPFALMMLVCLALVIFFPVISTGLLGR
jgi:tripartite ATP-independent transporter DctM subunit